MPTLVIRRFTGGIDANVSPHELRDDQFVELRNLMPSLEALSPRPTLEEYPAGSLPGGCQGLAEYFWGPGATTGIQAAGPMYATIVEVDNTIGTADWRNDQAAKLSDDLWASGDPPGDGWHTTYRLVWRDFRFNIPSSAQILGIKVEFERHYRSAFFPGYNAVRDAEVKLRVGPATFSQDRKSADAWSVSVDRWDAYGGDTDLWGLTPTPATINAADFAVVLAATCFQQTRSESTDRHDFTVVERSIPMVDSCRVTVYYRIVDAASGLFGREVVAKVGQALYSDRPGIWQQVNDSTTLMGARGSLRAVGWLNTLYIQDGETGPWKYAGAGGTFSQWGTGATNPPPVARFILLDKERLYLAHVAGDPNAVRTSTIGDPDDWPTVAKPGSASGMAMWVGRDDGDYITGLVRFAGTKVILKRRSVWALYGDDVDTWQLRKLFAVGCESDEAWADMGAAAAWTDGERLYLWDGTSLSPDFGLPVERYLRSGPGPRKLVWWDGRLLVWYSSTSLVVWDGRYRAWYGPWEDVPQTALLVRRDDGTLVLADTLGNVWTLTGEGVVDWQLETKHHSFGRDFWEHMFRTVWIRGQDLGRMEWSLVDRDRLLRSGEVTISGVAEVMLPVLRRSAAAGLRIRGRSGASSKLMEIALEAEPVRRIRARR